jgi:surfactin synthase thioesterase subunit
VAGAIAENFASVDADIIRQRLKTIGSVNAQPTETLKVPAVYVQASDDRLVLPKKLPDFNALCPLLTIDSVEGGHFVLQENPQASAQVLLNRLSGFL